MTIINGIKIDCLKYNSNPIKESIVNNNPIEEKLHVIAVISWFPVLDEHQNVTAGAPSVRCHRSIFLISS